jgi:hypothetical protein
LADAPGARRVIGAVARGVGAMLAQQPDHLEVPRVAASGCGWPGLSATTRAPSKTTRARGCAAGARSSMTASAAAE